MLEAKFGDDPLTEAFLEHAKYHDRTFCEDSNWLKALTDFVKSSFIDFWLGLKNDFCQGHLDWEIHAQCSYDSISFLNLQSVLTVQC